MIFTFQNICKLGLLLAVAACGGGGGGTGSSSGGTGPGTPAPSPSYLNLASQTNETGQINGAALATNTNNGTVTAGGLSGTLQHWNGNLSINNGVVTFTSTGPGLQLGGVTTGTNSSTLTTTSALSNGFEYLTVFQSQEAAGGNGIDGLGVIGIGTNTSDMPSFGSATYSGDGEATLVTQSDGTILLTEGNATLTVNFSAGTGNLTLNQFSATDASGAPVSGSPIQNIKMLNMNVSGNSLSGGNLVFNSNQSAASILGANTSAQSRGQFFGHDGTAPSEVGGVIHASGDMGVLNGLYVAQ